MTTKKKKFATTLLTTALLTCGFTLETDAEPQAEVQAPTEVSATTTETEPQDLAQTKRKTGQTSPYKAAVSPSELPEEQTPLGDSKEQTQSEQAHFEDLKEQHPVSGLQDQAPPDLEKHHFKTGQPSPENVPTSHGKPQQEQRHQLSKEPNTAEPDSHPLEDILQKILNNTYEFCGDEVIYTETAIIYITFPTAEELKAVYVNGFGWVEPSNEPSIRIQALDMMENGVKVGTMGG